MGDMGKNFSFEIRQNPLHRLARIRSGLGKPLYQSARTHIRCDSVSLRLLEIVGHPVDDLMAEAAELFGGHITEKGLDGFSGFLV